MSPLAFPAIISPHGIGILITFVAYFPQFDQKTLIMAVASAILILDPDTIWPGVGLMKLMNPAVCILASARNGTLYVGVSSDLHQRMAAHDQGLFEGFTKRYGVKMLVYYEMHLAMPEAIAREQRVKKWNRIWKLRLIEQMNPEWQNLFDPATGETAFGPAEVERLTGEPENDGKVSWFPPSRE